MLLDLGCGNGALLKRINQVCHNTRPFGIDYDATRIEHAQCIMLEYDANFVVSDIFNNNHLWNQELYFKVAILMPGRLIECNSFEDNQF